MARIGRVTGGQRLREFSKRSLRLVREDIDLTLGAHGGRHSAGRITYAGILVVNEFGSSDGVIPERAPVRKTIARHGKAWARAAGRASLDYMLRRASRNEVFQRVGRVALRDLIGTIRKGLSPALSPSTFRPGRPPLILTGEFLKSLTWQIRKRGTVIREGR